ncbi:Ovochymase-1 [Coemansia nantahalensis]|uniref:Ovochymase-1 n=1 Tax=Coemansia nantahalensis TaxID=2789366 RepID=A0ACC1JS07_9FUNG|nr:Ovochymase-1 [Coemansia nantahalensis]KAJ2770090.1 Ovochymase-1 [Coemansia nantahalensis]
MPRLPSVATLLLAAVSVLRGAESSPVRALQKRIYGGNDMPTNQAPYAVSVTMWAPSGNGNICGGTLISDRHVVTAAHCLTSVDDRFQSSYTVTVGYNSQQKDKQTRVNATKIDIHPGYDANNDYKYDIAILTIPPITFGTGAQRMPIDDGQLEPRQPLLAVGWGHVESTDDLPNSLKKTTVEIGDIDGCRRFQPGFDDSNGQVVCTLKALTPGKAICQGDSGSGVSIDRNGKQYLVGLGSRIFYFDSTVCGGDDSATFFVHLSKQLDFITQCTGLTREYLLGKQPSNIPQAWSAAISRAIQSSIISVFNSLLSLNLPLPSL